MGWTLTWDCTLAFWQSRQLWTQSAMTEFMDIQTNLLLMMRRVALTPGWAMLWSASKTCLWSCCGTKGRKLPVDESPKSTLLPTATEVRVMDGKVRRSCTCGQVAWSSAISDIEEGGGMG